MFDLETQLLTWIERKEKQVKKERRKAKKSKCIPDLIHSYGRKSILDELKKDLNESDNS